jgi:hypothetical protein
LEAHRNSQAKKGSKTINKIGNIMQNHYNAIKTQLGLDEALAPSSEDEKDDYICKCSLALLISF